MFMLSKPAGAVTSSPFVSCQGCNAVGIDRIVLVFQPEESVHGEYCPVFRSRSIFHRISYFKAGLLGSLQGKGDGLVILSLARSASWWWWEERGEISKSPTQINYYAFSCFVTGNCTTKG